MLKENEVAIGKFASPHGIKGDIKIVTLTDFPERFHAGNEIKVKSNNSKKDDFEVFKITSSVPVKGLNFTVHLEGVEDRNKAEELSGSMIFIFKDELMDLGEDESYIFELVGIEVFTDKGDKIGIITDVLQSGANDVYVIDEKICIPAIKDCILEVNPEKKKMVIFPMPGLL